MEAAPPARAAAPEGAVLDAPIRRDPPDDVLHDAQEAAAASPVSGTSVVSGRVARRETSGTRRGLVNRIIGPGVLAFASYLAMGVGLWWHAWGHFGHRLPSDTGDPGLTTWSLAAVAQQLAAGHLPFFSGAVWAPNGVNLLDNTTDPLIGTLLAPLTLTAGPIASYVVALSIAPALSAISCRWAATRFGVRGLAAWIAGLLYGFSPFVVGAAALGQLGEALIAAPPLLLGLGHDLFVTRRHVKRTGVLIGVVFAGELFVSTEVFAMCVLMSVVGCALGALCARRQALQAARAALPGIARAGLVALVLLAYPLYDALAGPRHIAGAPWVAITIYGIDFSTFFTLPAWVGHPGGIWEIGGYFGAQQPPIFYAGWLLAGFLVAAAAWLVRRAEVRFLLAFLVVSLAFGAGAMLHWHHIPASVYPSKPHTQWWMPWTWLGRLPVLSSMLPQRLLLFYLLGVSIFCAYALQEVGRLACRAWERLPQPAAAGARSGHRRRRSAGPPWVAASAVLACATAVLWPSIVHTQVPLTVQEITPQAWYSDVAPRLPPGSVVLAFPFPGTNGNSQAMVADALAGLPADLVGGYIFAPAAGGHVLQFSPTSKGTLGILASLTYPTPGKPLRTMPADVATVSGALSAWHVRVIVMPADYYYFSARDFFVRVTGTRPRAVDGMWEWSRV